MKFIRRLGNRLLIILALCGLLVAFQNFSTVTGKKSQVTGELEIMIEDHPNRHVTRHFLKTDKGRLELKFKSKTPDLESGSKLQVSGDLSGNVLELSAADAVGISVVAPAALPNAIGEQRVAVLLVNFQDNMSESVTTAWTNEAIFNHVNTFMRENSYQKMWLTGNVFGWHTLPINATCATNTISTAAKQAAATAGVDLSGYSRLIYVFPRNYACGWSGVGTVGSMPSEAWINGASNAALDDFIEVTAHEMGHNLGLQHSHSLDCDLTPLGTTCATYEYGDVADAMGNTAAGHFNAFQKERLGWLNNIDQPAITTVVGSGTFAIEPYETVSTYAKALKVLKSIDSLSGAKTWYYIEYRQPIGTDRALSTLYQSNLVNGVLIRTGTDNDRRSSFLLDMTPQTIPTWDHGDAALTLGKSFIDPAAGVSITLLSMSGGSASIAVSFIPIECAHKKPSILISPAQQWGSVGQTLTYEVTIGNNDPSTCAASNFNVSSLLPDGWSQSPTSFNVTLAAGEKITKFVSITSPLNAAINSYGSIQETVTHGADASLSAMSLAYYYISATPTVDTTKPVSVITSPVNGSLVLAGSIVSINATTSDNVGVERVEFLVNNRIVNCSIAIPRTLFTCGWSVPKGAKKTYSLQTRAFDKAGNVGLSPLVKVISK